MKRDPIVLYGTVLGRSVARHPVAKDGTRMQASHDREVTLTLQFPIPNERPLEFSMRLDSLPRGWMEIGDPVTVTVASPEPEPVVIPSDANIQVPEGGLAPGNVQVEDKTEPYSIAPVIAEEETAAS